MSVARLVIRRASRPSLAAAHSHGTWQVRLTRCRLFSGGGGLVDLQRNGPPTRRGRECTVYIKGFLSLGEQPDNYALWIDAHRQLSRGEDEVEGGCGWGHDAFGYWWTTTGHSYLPRLQLPVPVITAAAAAYRLRRGLAVASMQPSVLVSYVTADVTLNALRLMLQYKFAERTARRDAATLAQALRSLREEHQYDYVRVVAHSLACAKVIAASASLPSALRPDELHLCAPACVEADVAVELASGVAREATHVYFSEWDYVLACGFRAAHHGHPAIGAVGVSGEYADVHAHDVSPHFTFFVHNAYDLGFANMAYGRPPRPNTKVSEGSDGGVVPQLHALPTLTMPGMKTVLGLKDAYDRGFAGMGLESRQQVEVVLREVEAQMEGQVRWIAEAAGLNLKRPGDDGRGHSGTAAANGGGSRVQRPS